MYATVRNRVQLHSCTLPPKKIKQHATPSPTPREKRTTTKTKKRTHEPSPAAIPSVDYKTINILHAPGSVARRQRSLVHDKAEQALKNLRTSLTLGTGSLARCKKT